MQLNPASTPEKCLKLSFSVNIMPGVIDSWILVRCEGQEQDGSGRCVNLCSDRQMVFLV